jgi:hypothetical protein
MRQTDKYYWAKRYATSEPEVVFFTGWIHDFYWVSDEPIPQPKIPLVLKDNHYYVIEISGNIMFPTVLGRWLGRWSCDYKCFVVDGGRYNEESVKVIAGPFTLDELVEFKPIK